MVNVSVESKLCLFVCYWLSSLFSMTLGQEKGLEVVKVAVKEGEDAILPCSTSSSKDIVQELFDWKKGHQEVFLYDAGVHYNNGHSGQDEKFKGRVSHFPEQLKFGNASIIIRKTKMTDGGNYTCDFPRLQPREVFHINLVVAPIFKNRLEENLVASPKPSVTIVDVSKAGVMLQCEVQGASSQPTLQWQDSEENILTAEEPQVSGRGGSYSVTLRTTVTSTSTNCFLCVVKQEEIKHMIVANITVSEKLFEDKWGQAAVVSAGFWIFGWICGFVSFATVLFLRKFIKKQHRKGSQQRTDSSRNGTAKQLRPGEEGMHHCLPV